MRTRLTVALATALGAVGLFAAVSAQAAAAPASSDAVTPASLVSDLDASSPTFRPAPFRAIPSATAASTAGRNAFNRVAGAALDALSQGPIDPVKTTGWQCAQFARLLTGIQIFGDAREWWGLSLGKYAHGSTPKAGSVLVFKPYGAMRLGHVSVVSQVLTDRIIQVTHANWSLIGGHRGQVEKDVTVVDVSAAGDWSQVKVWYDPKGDLGTTVYPTYGFIYQGLADAVTKFASHDATTAVVATR